jgi:hypothetical protein
MSKQELIFLYNEVKKYSFFVLKMYNKETISFDTMGYGHRFIDLYNSIYTIEDITYSVSYRYGIFSLLYNNSITPWQIWGYNFDYTKA